ncbi:hypothetical protein [Pandoraea sp. PE-S2T-3]|nr:hypothetical protein [Pandoraea sp. PE-S2T-3]
MSRTNAGGSRKQRSASDDDPAHLHVTSEKGATDRASLPGHDV